MQRGRKPNCQHTKHQELARLHREKQQFDEQLRQAETIITIQKSLPDLGNPPDKSQRHEYLIDAAEQLGEDVEAQQACRTCCVPLGVPYPPLNTRAL